MHVAPVTSRHAPDPAALLDQPGRMAGLSQAEQVKAVSAQFEAILIRQFLQDSVGNIMGGEGGGPGANIYGYMLTDVLSNQLSCAGGLGLSNILQQQLTPRAHATPATGHAAQKGTI